jgi:putative peptidoglycan lipid II flippase
VQILFERGRFLPADTAPTASALRLYAVGLIGYSTARIASPAFYALRESRVPVVVSICTIAANIVVSLALVRVLGYRGLALGTSVAALANGGLLLWLLRQRLNGIDGRRLAVALLKITAASLVMAAVVLVVDHGAHALVAGDSLGRQSLRLGLDIGSGLAALAASAKLLAIDEFGEAMALVRARIGDRT